MKSVNYRLLTIFLLSCWAFYSAIPTFIYFAQPSDVKSNQELVLSKIPSFLPQKHVNLGLDLQGGIQLVLGVNTDQAVQNKLERIGTEITRWASDNNKPVDGAYSATVGVNPVLRVTLSDTSSIEELRAEIFKEFPGLVTEQIQANSIDFKFDDSQIRGVKDSALEQAERVIRSRVDRWGVAEPLVARRADRSVLVQLPGFSDPERAKELLGRTAQLRFKIVDDEFTALNKLEGKLPEGVSLQSATSGRQKTYYYLESENADAIRQATTSLIPEDRELLLQRTPIGDGSKYRFTSHVVYAKTELTGEDILDANVGQSSSRIDGSPSVNLRFTGPGGKRFADVTGENINRSLAIVLDDEVVSAPNIQSKITGGSAEITLGAINFQQMMKEAQELSLILKSGALPATIEVLEERQVGASLGPELATRGIESILVGLSLVFLFMLVIYRRPGVIACLALFLNGMFLLGLMASFGFALTLPGIAGFILTLGMAVDANVLINERIRQELSEGRNAKNAVENGFKKAFWTIMDSNITTLIAALVLLETNSSGPIRGFAVTLMLGLVISLFTSLFCSKEFFKFALRFKTSDQDIRNWLGNTKAKIYSFDYLRLSPVFVSLSAVLVVGLIGLMVSRGGLNWSVDFAGGTEMEIEFSDDIDASQIRTVVTQAGIKSLELQKLDSSSKKYVLRFDRNVDGSEEEALAEDLNAQKIQSLLIANLAEFSPQVQRVDYVGPKVGRTLRNEGFKSAFLAICGVIAYLFLRFNLIFVPGALIKIFIDSAAVLAFYAFAWRSFDLTSVAALLTIIGYSVNDTIVIFDRIRENVSTYPKRFLNENINISVNETLTRAIYTSVTTTLALIGILIFGTSQIWNFAAAMAVGIISATLTSIFVSTKCIIWAEQWIKKSQQKQVSKA